MVFYYGIPSKLMGSSYVAQWDRIHLSMQERRFQSPSQEDSLEKEMATHSSVLERSLAGYRPWGHNLAAKEQQQSTLIPVPMRRHHDLWNIKSRSVKLDSDECCA